MRVLIIETSTERGMIAFVQDSTIVALKDFPFGYNQSKYLMPELKIFCETHQLAQDSLDCIAVGVGPGSYTGIRIGVAVAKALTYAWKLPLISFSSLEAFVPKENNVSFAAIIDAKIGGAYVLRGKRNEYGDIQYTSEPQVKLLEELGTFLNDAPILITPTAKMIKPKIEQLYPETSLIWEEASPDAGHLSKRIKDKYQTQEWSLDGHLELLYLRKTEAEMEKERKNLSSRIL